MNVLILTPDRVGSTLLQRLISVYAHANEPADALTINLHELTNGHDRIQTVDRRQQQSRVNQ